MVKRIERNPRLLKTGEALAILAMEGFLQREVGKVLRSLQRSGRELKGM